MSADQPDPDGADEPAVTPTPTGSSANGAPSGLSVTAIVAGLVALALGAVIGIFVLEGATNKHDKPCEQLSTPSPAELASGNPPLWKLSRPTVQRPVVIALGDYREKNIVGEFAVNVRPTAANTSDRALIGKRTVAAHLTGAGVRSATRPSGLTVTTRSTLSADGRRIQVRVCVWRAKSPATTKPGRYTGRVYVTGRRAAAVEVPIAVTVKSSRAWVIPLIVILALAGAAIAAFNTRDTELTGDDAARAADRSQTALSLVPAATGVVTGVVAGFALYLRDPTFGTDVADNLSKILAVTFLAGTGGQTIAAAPTRSVRRKVAKRGTEKIEAAKLKKQAELEAS